MNARIVTCATLALAAASGAARADPVDVTWNGSGAGQVINIVSPGYSGGVNCGQLLITVANSGAQNLDGSYVSFCTDVYQTIETGPNPYQVVPVAALPLNDPMGAVRAAAIGDLYAFAAGAQYGTDNDFACAFQLAIWEIVNDYTVNALDVTSGTFSATGYSGGVSTYLSALFGSIGTTSGANILGLGSELRQDLIIEVPGPGSLALIGLANLLKGGRRRA